MQNEKLSAIITFNMPDIVIMPYPDIIVSYSDIPVQTGKNRPTILEKN